MTAPTASETTYQSIRDRILAGDYPAGTRLREEELATDLGVSRTPIREALRRLAAEGLLNLRPNRGADVVGYDLAELEEIFELRAHLEGYGARRAAEKDAGPDLDLCNKLLDEMDAIELSDGHLNNRVAKQVARLNNEFHREILSATGSERLRAVLSQLIHLPLVHQTFRLYTREGLLRSFSHHRELVAAIAARDPAWAEAVMRAHILQGRSVLIEGFAHLVEGEGNVDA